MNLEKVDSIEMLKELSKRGGHPGALADAALLCVLKSQDYNQGMGHENIHTTDRTQYFPFGNISYAQMLYTKAMRFNSLVKQNGKPNFEGLKDTALDMINYAGFFIAASRVEKE
jgi:hypothetical protein